MAKLVALYRKPADAAAFDSHYFSKHILLAKTIPGLRSYEVSSGAVASLAGESAFHLVAMLGFDSLAAIQQGLASPQGAATAADLANFAQAGVDLQIFDTKEV
jgi:uncharacterized protein (TIGR02118 family)